MNGLTIDVRAEGGSSGSTEAFQADATVTFENAVSMTSPQTDNKNWNELNSWASALGGSASRSNDQTYDPSTHYTEEVTSDGVSSSNEPTFNEATQLYTYPAGTVFTFTNVTVVKPR